MSDFAENNHFLNNAVVAQSAEQLPCKHQVEGSIPSDSTTHNALVAQRSEQDAHNVLVAGSSPAEGTILEPYSEQRYINMQAQIQDQEECLELYEGVLRAIASITKVETPMDQSAEAFFFVASKMRKLAIAALQKTGAMR